MNAPANHQVIDHPRHPLTIHVFFDLVCPWSWIGIRHLEVALREFQRLQPTAKTKVQWRSHPLMPETPLGGTSYQSFYLTQFGGPTAVALRRKQVQQAGQTAGIAFDFKRINILPNTTAAHSMVGCVATQCTTFESIGLVDRLFRAFFAEGEDIGNLQVLERLGMEHGAKPQALLACLHDIRSCVAQPERERPKRGRPAKGEILSTPHFVFNGAVSVSGARSAELLLNGMLRSIEEEPQ